MNDNKFTPHEDGEDRGYFGSILMDDGAGRCYVKTPYFRDKIDAEKYTRLLCEANDVQYDYYRNIHYRRGEWGYTSKLKEIVGESVRGMVYDYVGDGWSIDLDHGRMGFLHDNDIPSDGVKVGEELMFDVNAYDPIKNKLMVTIKKEK